MWDAPKPVLTARSAARWHRSTDCAGAPAAFANLVRAEARSAHVIQQCMRAADGGDGILSAWATNVRTLADVAHEVPAPPQGLPEFGDKFSMLPFPERPLPLV
eukprot:3826198-Pleurochrysis_carterae.AAC.1